MADPDFIPAEDPDFIPAEAAPEKGFLDREIPLTSYGNATLQGLQTIGRGTRDAAIGIGRMVAHPIDTAKSMAELPSQAADVPAAIKDINASPDPTGTYAKVAQETAGQGAGQAILGIAADVAPRAIGPLVKPALRGVAKVAAPVVRGVVKGTNATLERAPGLLGAGAGAAIGHEIGMPGAGAAIGYGVGRELLPKLKLPGENFGNPIPTFSDVPLGPEHPGIFSDTPLGPEKPAPEVLNPSLVSPSRSLPGQNSPERIAPVRPSPAIPIPTRSGLALPPAPTASPIEIQQLLQKSMGGSELKPNVPLREQMTATKTAAIDTEGHTPVKSSALQSYKYDPAAREFHARATSGDTTYVYGDVGPEEAQAFEKTESKGKAWQEIRRNPLVAKIINGKRIAAR